MRITRDNYEGWALDYLEGNLEPGEKAAFEEFLSRNEDISAEIAGMRCCFPTIEPENMKFPVRRALYEIARKPLAVKLHRTRSLLRGAVAAVVLLGVLITLQHVMKKPVDMEISQNIRENNGIVTENTMESDIFAAGDTAELTETDAEDTEIPAGATAIAPSKTVAAVKAEAPVEDFDVNIPDMVSIKGLGTISTDKVLAIGPDNLEKMVFSMPEEPMETFGSTLRQSFATIIAPLDELNPLKFYRTEDKSGIEIASIRIGVNIKQAD